MENELYLVAAHEYCYLETDWEYARRDTFVTDKYMIVIVEKGTAWIAVGTDEFRVNPQHVLLVRPKLPVRLIRATGGFRTAVISFPSGMMHECTQRMEPSFFLLLYTRVAWTLSEENRKLVEHFRGLFRFSATKAVGYKRELILTLVTGFVFGAYEMCGSIRHENPYPDSSRSRELFHKFMRLLHEHYRTEHEVQFYAGELCISAKYLTQITKRLIAHTPKQIIDERLIHEATVMLNKNNSSIQEISNKLGFPDQSYFGRFFKRMLKMTPQQYRVRPKV